MTKNINSTQLQSKHSGFFFFFKFFVARVGRFKPILSWEGHWNQHIGRFVVCACMCVWERIKKKSAYYRPRENVSRIFFPCTLLHLTNISFLPPFKSDCGDFSRSPPCSVWAFCNLLFWSYRRVSCRRPWDWRNWGSNSTHTTAHVPCWCACGWRVC